MRSEIVFRAQDNLSNRYELCRKTARMARLLHFLSDYTSDAINDAFVRVANTNEGDPDILLSEDEGQIVADVQQYCAIGRVA